MRKIVCFLRNNSNKIRLFLFIAYCVFIVYYAVLSRNPSGVHRKELRLMWAYREMLIGHPEWKEDVGYSLKNILFFIPFGFFFPEKSFLSTVFKNRHWLLILCVGMLLSIFVELSQYIFCLGLCELDDVICNGFGAVFGYGIMKSVMSKYSRLKNKKELGQ